LCTLNACAEALALSLWLARDALARGHEISCHGYRWQTPLGMSEVEERAWIAKAVTTIEEVADVRPRGWHCRCPHTHTLNTRRLLVEHGSFLYDSGAHDGDLPRLSRLAARGSALQPRYTNDMRFQRPEAGVVRASDFSDYVVDTFDWLWQEGAARPKMMTIGLHLRIIGRPARIGGLDRVLAHMRAKGGVWFARRDRIAEHWLEHFDRATDRTAADR
jgi:peptidoglycan/xylan/chitin deacetylase (PgdA/CDA1 family)